MLRAATSADLPVLVRHRTRMWEDMGTLPRGVTDPSEAAYRSWLAPRMASREVIGWVAQAGDGLVLGSGLLWFQECQPRPTVPGGTVPYLLSMFVEEGSRRRGVARAIVQAAIDATRAGGHPRLSLHASEGRPLYASLGFASSPEMWLTVGKP
ncbi:MAG TPA: GNAT family N-acetyltransferase [Candidatus Thermoplasmatota archaeon]|nr:GNAT family N-acetyltransferase [Candidatus Thermoplasmatota archaeon]